MKNRNIITALQFTAALFLLFSLTTGICFALEVSKESAQLDIDGEDAGVYFIVTDPEGRRAGHDPVTKQYVEEFPASFGVSLKIRDEISEKYNSGGRMNLIPGIYTIEVLGVSLTTFDMYIGISRGIMSEGITNLHFNGITDKDITSKFQFTYNSDAVKPAGTLTRIASPSSLKQDITLSRKIGWIDNDGIMKSLLSKTEAIDASIAKGNKEAAKNQLNAFINEVNAQKGKHISDKAVKILLEDAQYLMDGLSK